MKNLFTIVFACYGLNANAQVGESKTFLYLYSDSIVYAKKIQFRPDLSGARQLRVDSKTYPLRQVKFINQVNGFFANTLKLKTLRTADFAERIIEGRINVFEEKTTSYSYPASYNPSYVNNGYLGQFPDRSMNIKMFYNKGYGDLKKLNYRNLKNDMASNTESMDLLHAYRKSMNTSTILYTAASASLAAGIISFVSGGKTGFSKPNFNTGIGLAVVALGFATGGYLNSMSADRKLEDAVEIYNE